MTDAIRPQPGILDIALYEGGKAHVAGVAFLDLCQDISLITADLQPAAMRTHVGAGGDI